MRIVWRLLLSFTVRLKISLEVSLDVLERCVPIVRLMLDSSSIDFDPDIGSYDLNAWVIWCSCLTHFPVILEHGAIEYIELWCVDSLLWCAVFLKYPGLMNKFPEGSLEADLIYYINLGGWRGNCCEKAGNQHLGAKF